MIGQNDSKNVLMKSANINGLMLPKFDGLVDLAQGHLPVNGKFSIEKNVKAIMNGGTQGLCNVVDKTGQC